MRKRYVRKIVTTTAMTAAVLLTGVCVEIAAKETEQPALETEAESELETELDLAIDAEALCGTYEGEKHIDAMNCDIAIQIVLEEDGTYTYYRAPMVIDMGEASEMPELEDEGTYERNENEIVFTGEELGEFTVSLDMEETLLILEGKIPTGGPSTELKLEKVEEAESELLETESESEQ